jgi:hypothetical protein
MAQADNAADPEREIRHCSQFLCEARGVPRAKCDGDHDIPRRLRMYSPQRTVGLPFHTRRRGSLGHFLVYRHREFPVQNQYLNGTNFRAAFVVDAAGHDILPAGTTVTGRSLAKMARNRVQWQHWKLVLQQSISENGRRDVMSKGLNQKKDAKKKPAKNLKEKRAEKQAKKQGKG